MDGGIVINVRRPYVFQSVNINDSRNDSNETVNHKWYFQKRPLFPCDGHYALYYVYYMQYID